MTLKIHQGQVLKQFLEDHRLKASEVAKTIGTDRTYFYALMGKERIPPKPLNALKEKLGFDPDNYVSKKTTGGTAIPLNQVKVPGSALKEAMKLAKFNQDEGAALLGVSRATMVRYWQKPELEKHVVDLVREKMGIDLEAALRGSPPAPIEPVAFEHTEEEDALMRFSTKLYKEFQVIRNLSATVHNHGVEISRLSLIVNEHDKSIVGVNAEVRDIIRRHDSLEKSHKQLQRRVNNFKK